MKKKEVKWPSHIEKGGRGMSGWVSLDEAIGERNKFLKHFR